MLQINKTIISLDIIEKKFICDIQKCHGICCVEGDSGAPLENEELLEIEDALPTIWDDLSEQSKALIEAKGVSYIDQEGDLVTSINNGKECVFTLFDEKGNCQCAFEKAWAEGKIPFRKPISCHLYPIRVKKYRDFVGVNYDQWDICAAARLFGTKESVPVYKFVKEPLIRKFGEEWYKEFLLFVKNSNKPYFYQINEQFDRFKKSFNN